MEKVQTTTRVCHRNIDPKYLWERNHQPIRQKFKLLTSLLTAHSGSSLLLIQYEFAYPVLRKNAAALRFGDAAAASVEKLKSCIYPQDTLLAYFYEWEAKVRLDLPWCLCCFIEFHIRPPVLECFLWLHVMFVVFVINNRCPRKYKKMGLKK